MTDSLLNKIVQDVPSDGAMREIFRGGGTLSRLLDGFEERRIQGELAGQIHQTLRRGEVGFFEAGTGTGKSLAYLIPAAEYALSQNSRVIVATRTISLQEQLVTKDLPLVQRLYPDLKFVLVKGWGNYICHLRLQARRLDVGELDLYDTSDEKILEELADWADTTQDGTRSDLSFEPEDRLWADVCAESDSCLRAVCPFYNTCHFFRDRARMTEAHILVVNHHLLFSDVALRKEMGWETEQAVLPHYDTVILDEAHHVEDVATAYMGATLAQVGVEQLFGRLYSRRSGRSRGVFPRLLEEADNTISELDVIQSLGEAKEAVGRFFQQAVTVLVSSTGRHGESHEYGDKRRLSPQLLDEWQMRVTPEAIEASGRLAVLDSILARGIKALGKPEETTLLHLKGQAEAARRRIAALGRSLAHFGAPDLFDWVVWIERTERRGTWRLVSAPIEVGPAFSDWAVQQCRSLVFVSATLAMKGRFDYLRGRLGLGDNSFSQGEVMVREVLYESPFDFEEQALVAVADDLPEPVDSRFGAALSDAIIRFVTASRGRALALFTSYGTLKEVRASIETDLGDVGIRVLAQGDAPRKQILEQFKSEQEGAVLLGTDSFWEGVDIPGENLSLVIVTRLPFDVPTDPVAMARSERVKASGGNPFGQYALPRAVLKLKQGFGRLIRTGTDRGVVVICDHRVVSRSYGRAFLEALPRCRKITASTDVIAADIVAFLQ